MRSVVLMQLAVCLFCPTKPVQAYDETAHHTILYAIALTNKLSQEDAALLANASQSLDENDTTNALPTNVKGFLDMTHASRGQVFHALTSPENRKIVEKAYVKRINRAISDAHRNPHDRTKKNRALLYLGQYLHFVADEVVHPHEPIIGHAPTKKPDRIDSDAYKVRIMAHLMQDKIRQFQRGRIKETGSEKVAILPKRLDPQLEKVTRAAEKAWRPNALDIAANSVSNFNSKFWNAFQKERPAMAAHHVRKALNQAKIKGGIPGVKPIRLDLDGEPIPTPENQRMFGNTSRSIEHLPLKSVANTDGLNQERKWLKAASVQLGFHKPAQTGGMKTEAIPQTKDIKGWALPSGPGGIALNPGLRMPEGLGQVHEIKLERNSVALVTSRGRFLLDSVEPRGLAAIMRTLAAGQIPFITIGTEPSDREGYAKVTYCPKLRGTREGNILYRADIQFKGIFAGYPFGRSYALNSPSDKLVRGYPGLGGEFSRLWITSSGIQLELDYDRIKPINSGMRILSETVLRGKPMPDPEMEAYTERLTKNWDKIAQYLPEFRMVEDLALATAIAFWVRENQVKVDPLLLTIPPKFDHTPDYAPLVAHAGRVFGVTGGVALTPEEKASEAGRQFLFQISMLIDNGDQSERGIFLNRLLWGAVAVFGLIIVVFVPAAVLWLMALWATKGTSDYLPFSRGVFLWAVTYLIHLLFAGLLFQVVSWGRLSDFDQDFLALMGTVATFPFILFLIINKTGRWMGNLKVHLRKKPYMKLALTGFGIGGSFLSGMFGVMIGILTISIFGATPGPCLESVLSFQLGSSDLLSQATVSGIPDSNKPGGFTVVPVPMSLARSLQKPYKRILNEPPKGAVIKQDGEKDPNTPFDMLHRVKWPKEMPVNPRVVHYSVDGVPPY